MRIILAEKNATYVVRGGVIELISLDEASDEKWFARRMIDVSETLELIRDVEHNRIGKPKPGSRMFERNIGSGGGGGVFAIPPSGKAKPIKPEDNAKDVQQLADAIVKAVRNSQPQVQVVPTLVTTESILIDAIYEAVFSEIWSNYHGSGSATISCVGGILIVNAPEEANEKVESFIDDLTFNMKTAAARRE